MYYRMRLYEARPERDEATRLFETFVRPVHEELGAKLVGRWRTSDGRTVVVWGYESAEECHRVLAEAANHPTILESRAIRRTGGLAGAVFEEVFMTPTVEVHAG